MYTDRKPGHEMDDTAASAANDRLEEILERVTELGGEITLDETTPLIIEFNGEMEDVGERRTVEFNIPKQKMDFQIIRDVKYMRATGEGHRKHMEKITRPMIETKLKSKPENSDQWIGVDLDDVF